MPKRIPLGAIGVTRNGKTVYPAVGTAISGEPFDFTSEELVEIAKLEKASGTQLVRKLISEDSAPAADTQTDTTKVALSLANSKAELQAAAAEREIEFADADSKPVLLDKITAFDAAKAGGASEDDDL
jgi:hypothetical protein